MPYLHFETDANRKAMVRAMEPPTLPRTATELTQDEVLMRAHMAASTSFLHIRRTLDQFFYHKYVNRMGRTVARIARRLVNDELSCCFSFTASSHIR